MTDTIFSPGMLGVLIGGVLFIFGALLWIKQRNLKNGIRAIASIIDAAGIPTYRNSLSLLRREISRVRRYQHTLSVVVIRTYSDLPEISNNDMEDISMNENGKVENASKQFTQIEYLLCGRILRDSLREVDLIVYDGAKNQFIIFLPESNRMEAEKTVYRLSQILGKRISDILYYGISEFPTDGLIEEDLIERAVESATKSLSSAYNSYANASNRLNRRSEEGL
jgi:hypothetical protein